VCIVSIIKSESKELNISKNRVFIFSTNTILDKKINLDLHIIDYNIVSRSASYDHQVVVCTLE